MTEYEYGAGVIPVVFAVGDRVQVIEVLPAWEAVFHRYAVPGTVERIDHKRPWAPIQVLHDDGERWAYAPRSLRMKV